MTHGKPIALAKLRALREALECDGSVTFKNGSTVDWSAAQTGPQGEEVEGRIVVTRPAGGIARYPDDDSGLRAAYTMALDGPRPKEQPSGDAEKYGDVPF